MLFILWSNCYHWATLGSDGPYYDLFVGKASRTFQEQMSLIYRDIISTKIYMYSFFYIKYGTICRIFVLILENVHVSSRVWWYSVNQIWFRLHVYTTCMNLIFKFFSFCWIMNFFAIIICNFIENQWNFFSLHELYLYKDIFLKDCLWK